MTDQAPDLPVHPARRSLWERVSIVWAIPFAALVIALGVAWQNWVDQGPVIEIAFNQASGVHAGETELRYRDVTVGMVEDVKFSETLENVLVSVRLDPAISEFVDADATFWVVQPEVSARGVSGLDTVLSGVFIEGVWDEQAGGLQTEFEGLDSAPLLRVGQEGLRIRLIANSGAQLNEASPILHRGIEVGRMGKPRLSANGTTATADAVIYEPHARLITTATRFWDTSGFSFSLGAAGAELDFSSLAGLISGALTFDTIVSGGDPVPDGTIFEVYPDEGTARNSIFADTDGPPLDVTVVFAENVRGLTTGAAVELNGVRIGEVTSIIGDVDEARYGDRRVRLVATLQLRPSRFGIEGENAVTEGLQFLNERVDAGLRARLATASLLTGGLKVEFVQLDDAEPAEIERGVGPFPVFPSVESDASSASATAEGLFQRINELPIEELLNSATDFLRGAASLATSEDLQRAPGEVVGLIGDVRQIVGSEDIQALPAEINALVTELSGTANELTQIMAELREADGIARLLAAVDAAGAAAAAVQPALDGVPGLIERVTAVAANAEAMPLEDLVIQARDLLASAEAIVGSDGAQALPGTLDSALGELDATIAAFNTNNGSARLLESLDSFAAAAEGLDGVLETAPGLIRRAEDLAATANELPLQDLVSQLNGLVTDLRAVAGSEDTRALPGAVTTLLGEAEALLTRLDEQEAVSRLLTAVDAAGQAAGNIGTATEGLPALIERTTALADRAQALPLEDLLAEATSLVDGADTLVRSEQVQAVPQALAGALSELEGILAGVQEGQGVERLLAAIDAAGAAARDVGASTEGLPALIERTTALAARAEELPLDGLITEATALAGSLDTVLRAEGMDAVPGALADSLREVQRLLAGVQEAQGVERLFSAVDAAGAAARSVDSATAGVPDLVARVSEVAETASELELQTLVDELSTVLRSADAVLATEGAQALPAALTEALGEVDAVLGELRAGGTVENVNRTLASADAAAEAIARSAEDLPELVDRVGALLNQAATTLATYDDRSEFTRDARSALREIQQAADAVTDLARTLERRPNSIILGR